MTEESVQEIQINIKSPNEKLQISITTDKTIAELKQALEEKSGIGAEQQRLIYAGRVLKDNDTISVYKIQSQHTIHMVKGASRPAASSASAQQPLPTMQTGQNPADPLTQLNSHQGFGAMAGINPFSELGLNVNDPNMFQTMMSSPQFLQHMSSMLSDPAVLDQIIASNPNLQSMAPQIRAAFQNEHFREMISNPERMQQTMQMANTFGLLGQGANPMAPFGGRGGFPAPGVPTSGAAAGSPANPSNTQTPPASGTNTTPSFNPYSLFGNNATPNAGQPPNPFASNPGLLEELMAGGAFGQNLFGTGAAPADTRPPEERYQVQLQQLQDMGFINAAQNVRALLATNGNVHSAIEYILGGGGL